jgi:hypothetical protein
MTGRWQVCKEKKKDPQGLDRISSINISCTGPSSKKCVLYTENDGEKGHRLDVELEVRLDEPNGGLGDEIYALPLVQFQSTSKRMCDVIGGIFLEKDLIDITKYRRIGAFDTGIDGYWARDHDSAVISNQRIIDYCRHHAGLEQVIEID